MLRLTTADLLEFLTYARRWASSEFLHYFDALAEAVKAAEWRPIEEAPRDGTPFDAWNAVYNSRTAGMTYDKSGTLRFEDGCAVAARRLGHYTHYRPLPAGPEVRG